MEPLDACAEWRALAEHRRELEDVRIDEELDRDPDRVRRCTVTVGRLRVDFSRFLGTPRTLELLLALARARAVEARRDALFAGEPVNVTEQRAAFHVALRRPPEASSMTGGTDVAPAVHAALERMAELAEETVGSGGAAAPLTQVVNIGMGGSDLGPALACRALSARARPDVTPHFVGNVDGSVLGALLPRLDPARTLFVVVSKTFTTEETLQNARTARAWLTASLGEAAVARHFIAVSAAPERAVAFGIPRQRVIPFWDWVGGRYSLWSAVGFTLLCCLGTAGFRELLGGAFEMDRHFAEAPPEQNLPLVLGLLSVWYSGFWEAHARAVLPYDQRLELLPAYLQQLDMESNGKRVTLAGEEVRWHTAPVVWGVPGTASQHAVHQLLHQGTRLVPADFIGVVRPDHTLDDHHRSLLAHFLAQPEALLRGKTRAAAEAELLAAGWPEERARALAPHRAMPGNRPSTILLLERLDPRALGTLLALYEHQTFVQGVVWGINSFDQWGVELGKQLAAPLRTELDPSVPLGPHDPSTLALLRYLRTVRTGA